MNFEQRYLNHMAELSDDDLLGVTGGIQGPTRQQPPSSPMPSIPSIPPDPSLPSATPTPTPTPTPVPTPTNPIKPGR